MHLVTCGERKIWYNIKKSQNIMKKFVDLKKTVPQNISVKLLQPNKDICIPNICLIFSISVLRQPIFQLADITPVYKK